MRRLEAPPVRTPIPKGGFDVQGQSELTQSPDQPGLADREALTAAISRDVVRMTKSITGRGPTKAKTYVHDDCVMVLMRDAHTPSEGSLASGGRQRAVAQIRVDMSEDARRGFIDIIEEHTGRTVVGFMSSSQQDPSLLGQIYVLEKSPLLAAVSDDPSEEPAP
jgi:uncharacterized protein YbcI